MQQCEPGSVVQTSTACVRLRCLGSLLAILFAASCGDEDHDDAEQEPPPPTGRLVLRVDHVIDETIVDAGVEYTTRYGQRIRFDEIRFWLSNIQLVSGDEMYAVPDAYYLVEQSLENKRRKVEIAVPPGTYDAIVVHIGVDPPPNRSLDLAAGELEAGIGMDWSWDTGYKFFRTEGTFVERDVSGRFAIHTGNDVLYKRLSATFVEPLVIGEDEAGEVRLIGEIDRLFAGVELSKNAEILGGTVDSLAGKVAGNYGRMFLLETAAGSIRMDASSPNLDSGDDEEDIPGDGTPPELTAAVVDVPSAMQCTAVPGRPAEADRACMTPFLLGSGTTHVDAGMFTFITPNAADVHAASTGIVSDIIYATHSDLTHTDLFDVIVRPNADSAFFLEYRNLKGLRVAEGDTVEAGQVIAATGDYFDASIGAVSFAVRREQELVQRLCPTRYMDDALAGRYDDALEASNAAWPAFQHASTCSGPSLVCAGEGKCDTPEEFVPAAGDIDAGRRIYAASCASCHAADGTGASAPELCSGPGCSCRTCASLDQLIAKIEKDMPPEGSCKDDCAETVAAFIEYAFHRP